MGKDGIGDYIHRKRENYLKFGTLQANENNESNIKDISQIIKNQHKRVFEKASSPISGKKIWELENALNDFFYPKNEEQEKNLNDFLNIFNEIVEKKGYEFSTYLSQDLDNSQKIISIKNKTKNLIHKDIEEAKNNNQIAKRRVSTLQKQLEIISKILRNEIKLKKDTEKNLLEFPNILNNTIKELQNLIKDKKETQFVNVSSNLQEQINTILEQIANPYLMILGDVLEYGLAYFSLQVQNKKGEITKDLLDSLVIGTTGRTAPTMDFSQISSDFVDINNLDFKGWQKVAGEDFKFQLSAPTQDKTDVIFNYSDNAILNISAKNYSLKDSSAKIHILSGSSLLQAILNENNPSLMNHWLNMVSSQEITNKSSNFIPNYKETHNTILLSLLLQGLMGTKGELANIFVLNSRSNKHIYVRNIFSILKNFEKSGYTQASFGNNFPTKDNPLPMDISASDAKTRITKLIAELHQRKLNIQIDRKLVNKKI